MSFIWWFPYSASGNKLDTAGIECRYLIFCEVQSQHHQYKGDHYDSDFLPLVLTGAYYPVAFLLLGVQDLRRNRYGKGGQ